MPLPARVATPADLDAVVETISLAFYADPVWSWAFPEANLRAAQFRRWWPLFVESALPHGWVWRTAGAESVTVWTPPGLPELSAVAEARVPGLLDELLGERSRTVLRALLQFEAARPHDELHYYLSFVATHDDHRRRGIAEQLLAENLALIDAEHLPEYL